MRLAALAWGLCGVSCDQAGRDIFSRCGLSLFLLLLLLLSVAIAIFIAIATAIALAVAISVAIAMNIAVACDLYENHLPAIPQPDTTCSI